MEFQSDILKINVQSVDVELAYSYRKGHLPPLVSLHGFGSTKEDYADLALHPDFDGRTLLFWDAPGCGASKIGDPSALSIPFLVEVAVTACDAMGINQFHLSGHSMGGLTALLLADAYPEKVLSFIDIEGNVAPEDCFLSRQIIEHPADTPKGFRDGFIERVRKRPEYASALYAATLPLKVQDTSYEPIFTSMVDLSDNTPLMDKMAGLKCPRIFVYGEQNRHLSYLSNLPNIGVEPVEIAHSGHFPMYSNPPALWDAMSKFLNEVEGRDAA